MIKHIGIKTMTLKSSAGFLALSVSAALSLAGCVQAPAANVASIKPIYSTDLQGKAPQCIAPLSSAVADGKTLPVTLTMGGKGWCGLLIRNGNAPYAAGLLSTRPAHGKVYVHSVGDDTRIDYIPTAAVVADQFAVKLVPGNALVDVKVEPAAAGAAK